MSSKLSSNLTVKKRIDDRTQFYPPLDYSFRQARTIEGMRLVIRTSFEAFCSDATSAEPRVAAGMPEVIRERNRYHSYGVYLNHNLLSGPLEDLPAFIRTTLLHPTALAILDLSFNKFTEIPSVSPSNGSRPTYNQILSLQAVSQCPALTHLYFHKNLLADVSEIGKLISLKHLKHLTLHGNPLMGDVPYARAYVLCLCPSLRSLNCTPISRADLKTSSAWGQMNRNLLPRYLRYARKS